MEFARFYHSLVERLLACTGGNDAALHIHAGLLILFITRACTGRRLETMVPLAAVILAQLMNEFLDRLFWGAWRWDDTARDTVHTLLWPVLLSWAALICASWPNLFATDTLSRD